MIRLILILIVIFVILSVIRGILKRIRGNHLQNKSQQKTSIGKDKKNESDIIDAKFEEMK